MCASSDDHAFTPGVFLKHVPLRASDAGTHILHLPVEQQDKTTNSDFSMYYIISEPNSTSSFLELLEHGFGGGRVPKLIKTCEG